MAPQARPRHNLPTQLTSFVGRARELAEVADRLEEHRLVTLAGTGGVGKTRLALEAAVAAVAFHRDGVFVVELAPLSDPAQVPREVAARLGIEQRRGQEPESLLLEALVGRELLLVLDNCEHLVDAAAVLTTALLRACPGVRVLATSRERLGVPGEAVYVVPALDAPDPGEAARPEELAHYGAVQLFVDRARLTRSDFALDETNAGAVAAICRRLDGIPLAIELAAVRVRALPVQEIAARLTSGPFRLLTGGRGAEPRQQTLAAAIDWSYDLLTEPERALLARLSVFVGGFALDAAEAVCGGDAVLDDLTGLVDKSLVVAERRYRLLEPIRQYAAGKLAEAGEVGVMCARHSAWCLAFAERAVDGMILPEQVAWFERLVAEHGNMRAALELSRLEPNPEAELRLVGAMAPFWARSGHFVEGRARIDDVLPRTERVSSPAGCRARVLALDWRGHMETYRDSGHAERAVALARELGDLAVLAQALRHLAMNPAGHDQARALLGEAVDAARRAGVPREVGYSLSLLARLLADGGELDEADALASEALVVLRQAGDRDALRVGLGQSARVALRRGERAQARAWLAEAAAVGRDLPMPDSQLQDATILAWLDREEGDTSAGLARLQQEIAATRRAINNPTRLADALIGVAGMAVASGDPRAAARLLGATKAFPARPSLGSFSGWRSDWITTARAAHGEEAFAAAWAEGERMSLEEAADYALSLEPPPSAPAPGELSSPLTPREQEVAALIAEGQSNRGIADALVIAEPTAERHVANIFNKLGMRSRAQVAAWHERQRGGA